MEFLPCVCTLVLRAVTSLSPLVIFMKIYIILMFAVWCKHFKSSILLQISCNTTSTSFQTLYKNVIFCQAGAVLGTENAKKSRLISISITLSIKGNVLRRITAFLIVLFKVLVLIMGWEAISWKTWAPALPYYGKYAFVSSLIASFFLSCGIGYICKTCKTKPLFPFKDCFLYKSKCEEVITIMLCWLKIQEIPNTSPFLLLLQGYWYNLTI